MKIGKIVFIAALCTVLVSFAGCNSNDPPAAQQPTAPQAEAPSEHPLLEDEFELVPDVVAPADDWDYDIDNPESPFYLPAIGRFELTESELAYYAEYIRTGDLAALYGVEPLSVLKVWIQAGIEGQVYEEFQLFHPDTLYGETFEEYYMMNMSDGMEGTQRVRQRFADIFFAQLEDGDIVEQGDRVLISFDTEVGERLTLSLRLNDDGIWLVERDLF